MVKKSVKKKPSTRAAKTTQDQKIEKVLVENFVSLQRVMVNLSTKFDKLTNQLSGLLEIFEKSAEALAKKDFSAEQKSQDTDQIIEGIKNLSEQNKVIARGLTLVHESKPPQGEIETAPFPEPKTEEVGGYKKSISSRLRKLRPISKE